MATKCVAAFVAVVVVVLGVFWGIPPAGAAELVTAPPAPVEPLPVLPSVASQAVEGTQQMGGLAMDAQRNLARAAAARAAAASAGTVVEDTVVPLTKAASFARGAGGVLLISPNIGWAIGQGGLVAYATATGTDYTTMICNTPDWYQGTNAFLSFGITADCKGTMVQPNADKQGTPTLTYSGTTITVVGRTTFSSSLSGTQGIPSNWPYRWCVSAQAPAGTQLQSRDYVTSSRWTVVYPTAGTGGQYSCASGRFDMDGAYSNGSSNYANTDTLRLVSSSSGTVVATQVIPVTDPSRTPTCKITWKDGTTTTGTGTVYQESTGLPSSAAGLGCEQAYVSKPGAGPGLLPSQIEVDSTDDTGAKTQISTQSVPNFGPTETKSMAPSIPNRGLVLEKVVNGVTDSCMTWAADCSNWWSKTSNGTTTGTATETFKCTFGGDPVPLTQCSVYQHTFDTQTSTPVVTIPSTGVDTPWITGTEPLNTTNPGVGVGTDPGGQCMAEWPSAPDPISWILQPVKCALVWAFVPRSSVVTQVQTKVTTAWAPTAVGQIGAMLPAWLTPPTGSGCAGPHVNWTINWPTHVVFDAYPLSACGEPVATIATLARLIASVLLIGYTIFGVSRRISAIVSAPGVGPGS
ncbi:hypothetical protein [Microbacterium sp. 13-71-7]|uniref:hypothetical protein n=1 Tax=Microbacterium sp. 13-71-7 TaxID=1970399 RepID=UPI000BDC94C4|nr:hypothetical protein [Microbacterium sp. 13-71-7]OZB85736.1 MAG: hypothetical protein B7X32_02385 [Microbacterium sp. 13-71-7]